MENRLQRHAGSGAQQVVFRQPACAKLHLRNQRGINSAWEAWKPETPSGERGPLSTFVRVPQL
jgi:hypothetical protein